jgi:type II secretory pathway component PulC
MVMSLLAAVGAAQAANPYREIVERNAFGLRPLVVEKVPVEIELPAPPANIVLTGMAVFEGEKQVYLSVTKAGEKVTKYLSLAESEREEGVEVVQIDVRHDRVSIKYNGQPAVLTFETNGAKTVTVAPPLPTRGRK